jgi:hypothetical protein
VEIREMEETEAKELRLFNRVILGHRIQTISWSITMLSLGIAFVYGTLYESANTDVDMFLKTYSVGVRYYWFVDFNY